MSRQERRLFTEDLKREAARLIETSGRTISQIATDLDLGFSTLTRWKRPHQEADLLADILAREII